MNRPSPVMKNAALAVRSGPTSRNRASVAIVVVPGVAISSIGWSGSGWTSGLPTTAICWLAAYPHASHTTRVSSPYSLRNMNSWAPLPPMIPTSAPTTTVSRPRRSKIRRYAPNWSS